MNRLVGVYVEDVRLRPYSGTGSSSLCVSEQSTWSKPMYLDPGRKEGRCRGSIYCARRISTAGSRRYIAGVRRGWWDFCLGKLQIAVLIALCMQERAGKLQISSIDGGCRKYWQISRNCSDLCRSEKLRRARPKHGE